MTAPRIISRTATSSSDLDTDYKWGFTIDIDADVAPKGLSEDIVRLISAKKEEPGWMLEWRLKAYRHWERLNRNYEEPKWANVSYPPIDYQDIYYYAAPSSKEDAPRVSTKSTLKYWRPSTSWAYRWPSRKSWPGWPSTPCWTASPSPPPTRKRWKKQA